MKEIERYGSELKKEYSEYYKAYRHLVNVFNTEKQRRNGASNNYMDVRTANIFMVNYDATVHEAKLQALEYYNKISKQFQTADTKVNELLDSCKNLGVDIENPDILVLCELKKLIDKYKKLSDSFLEYCNTAVSYIQANIPIQTYIDPDMPT